MQTVNNIRSHFIQALQNKDFVQDKYGSKTIELIGASFIADEPSIFGKVNEQYVEAELAWYESTSPNINDIYPWPQYPNDKAPPEAWQHAANAHGEINSNYGKLIYTDKYFNQYGMALDELIRNSDSRRATMIYTRPSIWEEYCEDGKNDFICTNSVTYYLRGGAIHAVVQMRSNDVVYGYKNDYAWQFSVLKKFVRDYNAIYLEKAWDADYRKEMGVGTITWQVQNLHVYERHFHLVK